MKYLWPLLFLLLVSCDNWQNKIADEVTPLLTKTFDCKRPDLIHDDVVRLLNGDKQIAKIDNAVTCGFALSYLLPLILEETVPPKWECDLNTSVPKIVNTLLPLCDLLNKE